VGDVVRQQTELGLEIVDDGEFGKPDFVGYINERLAEFEPGDAEVALSR
jgi:5-methyltetrahydropteroyltriglutamate--homocysteine methyltransferase